MRAFVHQPVMVSEVLEGLNPTPAGRYLDGTIGGGGHAAAILESSAPAGWLSGCDRDGDALEAARGRLAVFGGRFELRQGTFESLVDWIEPGSCNGAILDLGVSSPQLDWAERGFSFQQDGPLDMRMDTRQVLTAAAWLEQSDEAGLARVFWEYGEEPAARRIARAIGQARHTGALATTGQLAALIERVSPRRGQRAHPATRVFQALRMVVNDELGLLARGLPAVWTLLKPGGRLAVLTFHSLEARAVKRFGQERARAYTCPGAVDVPELRQPRAPELRWVTRKARAPSAAESASNPRARSAQLRVFEKL